jgi:hypothetical protein
MLGPKYPIGEQYLPELIWLLDRLRFNRCASVLEVGSRKGYTLRYIGWALEQEGLKLRCITLPHETNAELKGTITEMRERGLDADALIADSHSEGAVKWAQENGPFDAVFIDGDHSYNGVQLDWFNYPSKKLSAFHDIGHPKLGIRRFWSEMKLAGYPTEECIASDGIGLPYPMGIGIVLAWD